MLDVLAQWQGYLGRNCTLQAKAKNKKLKKGIIAFTSCSILPVTVSCHKGGIKKTLVGQERGGKQRQDKKNDGLGMECGGAGHLC